MVLKVHSAHVALTLESKTSASAFLMTLRTRLQQRAMGCSCLASCMTKRFVSADDVECLAARQHSIHGKTGVTAGTCAIQELELATEDAKVYKLIGPTLIKQDPVEAKSNVNKRLEFIKGELSRLDARLADYQGKAAKRQQQVTYSLPPHAVHAGVEQCQAALQACLCS